MQYQIAEILEFVEEHDVKFVRLAFCDLFGAQKNMAIMSYRLKEAFEKGIGFDATTVNGFSGAAKSDLLLFPDPFTMKVLPWRPQQGKVLRFLCDIRNPDGSPYICDTRNILKRTVKRAEGLGYDIKMGVESDFYLFKTDAAGEPTLATLDEGSYLDIAPADKGENVRREICLSLEEMGIRPLSSHHEKGPGQNNIDFQCNSTLAAADNFMTFRTVAKAIAARNGLYVSFMPKPLPDRSGSGLHINMSVYKGQENLFENFSDGSPSASFAAGILNRISEVTAFLNPISNSYERLGKDRAPAYISWSKENRAQLLRIPTAAGNMARMELRSPDPYINPYLAFSVLIEAGLKGIINKEKLPPAVDSDLSASGLKLKRLPETLTAALAFAAKGETGRAVLGEEAFSEYLRIKKIEGAEADGAEDINEYGRNKYFKVL